MNSKQLCKKLGIDERELARQVAAGLPRAKVRGKWVYDEKAVAKWIWGQTQQGSQGDCPHGVAEAQRGKPAASAPLEIIARSVPECLRVMAELGYPKSDRVFRTWITEPKFPGKPGRKGKQDGEFPVYAILRWAGEISSEEPPGPAGAKLLGPKERILDIRARREEIELAKLEKKIVDRDRAAGTLARVMAVLRTVCDAIPDLVTARLPEDQKPAARGDVEESLRKAFEVAADLIEEDQEALEKE
jgi:hypothetical protein